MVHCRMLDATAQQQQEALGVLGVNIVHGALTYGPDHAAIIAYLMDDLNRSRMEVRCPSIACLSCMVCRAPIPAHRHLRPQEAEDAIVCYHKRLARLGFLTLASSGLVQDQTYIHQWLQPPQSCHREQTLSGWDGLSPVPALSLMLASLLLIHLRHGNVKGVNSLQDFATLLPLHCGQCCHHVWCLGSSHGTSKSLR